MEKAADCEAISCWPPPESTGHSPGRDKQENSDNTATEPTPTKNKLKSPVILDETPVKKRRGGPLEIPANVAVAKWWKSEGRVLCGKSPSIVKSTNPNTLLRHIARLPECQTYMKREVRRLSGVLKDDREAHTLVAMATFTEKLGELESAIQYMEEAVSLNPQDKEYQWLLARMKRQQRVNFQQEKSKINLPKEISSFTMKQPKQVERRKADTLSVEEFLFEYAMTSTPVVITGLADKITSVPWTLKHIQNIAGECTVVPKRLVPGSVEWAQLEDTPPITLSHFLNHMQQQCPLQDKLYLFDWSIPIHCPQLAKQLVIPKYFADDFLQRTEPGSLYHDSWPSLFIAPEGLRSELHVDAFGSNFWMALFEGSKRWVFFQRGDTPLLYPRYEHSMDPTFDVDLGDVDFESYPLLSLTQPAECILKPGDVLFVPAGCAHRVQNLETSLAISGNFVNLSNLSLVKEELAHNALVDERAENILKQINKPDFPVEMNSDLEHLSWNQFKKWPNDYTNHDIKM